MAQLTGADDNSSYVGFRVHQHKSYVFCRAVKGAGQEKNGELPACTQTQIQPNSIDSDP